MSKIEQLTQEQIDQMPSYVEKWLGIGLSKEPVDFDNAVEAAKLAYKCAGLDEPKHFYTTTGPNHAIEFITQLFKERTGEDKKSSEIFSEMSFGAHDAAWLSFYSYMKDVVILKDIDSIQGLVELAKHTGWLSMYDDTVIFQDRPSEIVFDEDNLLHNEFGPAIEYRDGTKIYSWHGVTVPAEWIEDKENLLPETALTWENVEQRRCACEIIGWVKVLSSLDYTVVDSDDDPMIGDLLEVDLPEIGKEKFLQVVCGTGRTFALPVPPEMKTALAANAWTYDCDEDIIKNLEVRT